MDDSDPAMRVSNNKKRLILDNDISTGLQVGEGKSNASPAMTIKIGTKLHAPCFNGFCQNVVSNFSMI